MAGDKTARVVLLALACTSLVQGRVTVGEGRNLGALPAARDDIPQLCAELSVTPVSCAQASSPDALLPHPDDCRLFYYCVSAALPAVCRACPAGLHFSPAEHVCDAPGHAGCALTTTEAQTDRSTAAT